MIVWAVFIAVGLGFIGAFTVNTFLIRRHVRRLYEAIQCGETLGDLVCTRERRHRGPHVSGEFAWFPGDRFAWSPRHDGSLPGLPPNMPKLSRGERGDRS